MDVKLRPGRLPAQTGWILLAVGIPVSVLEPISGGWSLIAIGVLALWPRPVAQPR